MKINVEEGLKELGPGQGSPSPHPIRKLSVVIYNMIRL